MNHKPFHWPFSFLLLIIPSFAYAVDVSTATGKTITFDNTTGIATVVGDAVVTTSSGTLKAEKININLKNKKGTAEGNVRLVDSSSTITGTAADYYWEASTGTIRDAVGVSPPWTFSARELVQTSPEYFFLKEDSITSCNEVPPHYSIRSGRAKLRRGKRIKLYNARLVPDQTPVFWLPFYTKSLIPHKWRLRIEPGHTSRDGYTAKTIFGYPFTEHTWTDFRWDYLQRTGNGGGLTHRYDARNINGIFDSYYIRDSNPDKEVPRSKRYTILWTHFQRFTPKLTANARFDLKSDQSFGNAFGAGNQIQVENQTRGLLSEAGFTYQFPIATLQADMKRKDKFDSVVSSKQFISQITLPRLSLNTAPLTGKYFPAYASFNGSYLVGNPIERAKPTDPLLYTRSATAGTEIKKDIRVNRKWTITPLGNYNETWENRVVTSTGVVTETDRYTSRYTLGGDVRRRFFRVLDAFASYRYTARNRPNQTLQDTAADDHGVEQNQMNGSFQTRLGRSSLLTLNYGYDYRAAPKSQPTKYQRVSERVIPPSMDLQWVVKKNVTMFFRETYGVYDARTKTPIGTPINTAGELQLGNVENNLYFSQGFSYSKKGFGEKSQLFLNNRMKFYLSRKWYLDLTLNYRAVGESKLNYQKLFPISKTLRVVRDMHCWILRGEFSKDPTRTDASFYIDLKTNVAPANNVFANTHPAVYSTRDDGPDLAHIFPPK